MSKFGSKTKELFSRYKLGDFFRNIVAVMLGIIITFYGDSLIKKRSIHHDTQTIMTLIKKDLIENKKEIHDILTYFDSCRIEAKYILDVVNNKRCADSLQYYHQYLFSLNTINMHSSSIDLLKASNIASTIENKDLVANIFYIFDATKVLITELHKLDDTRKGMIYQMTGKVVGKANEPELYKKEIVTQYLRFISNTEISSTICEEIDSTIVAIDAEFAK